MKSSYSQTSILISDATPPQAMLTDFCFAHIVAASTGVPNEEHLTPSFMAPELLLPTKFGLEKGTPSKEADIYALGMTIYQVLTGKQPFLQRRKARIVRAVILGERPAKPENAEEIGMTEYVWDLLEECWREDRTTRPNASDTLKRLWDIISERKSTDFTNEVEKPRPNVPGDRDPTRFRGVLAKCEWGDSPLEHPYSAL